MCHLNRNTPRFVEPAVYSIHGDPERPLRVRWLGRPLGISPTVVSQKRNLPKPGGSLRAQVTGNQRLRTATPPKIAGEGPGTPGLLKISYLDVGSMGENGGPRRIRTYDLPIKSRMLYQLS